MLFVLLSCCFNTAATSESGARIIQFDTIVYKADNIEPHLTGMVKRYLLLSNNAPALLCEGRHGNAAALSCKHHENGSGNAT